MTIRKNLYKCVQIIFSMYLLLVGGCISTSSQFPTPSSTVPPSSTSSPSPSETPTRRPILVGPSPTFPPTIPASREDYLIRLLQVEDCELPCYLGITPGETSWDEAQMILENIGAYRAAEGYGDGMRMYGYSSWIGDPSLVNVTRESYNTGVGDMEINQDLGFSVWENKVHRIQVDVKTRAFVKKFGKYWAKYSLERIFLQHGPPDFVSILVMRQSDRYIQFTVYQDLGIVIETNGIKKDNKVCPISLDSNPGISVVLKLVLTDLNYGLDIYNTGQIPPTDSTLYLPIREALGITEAEYYKKVVSDPLGCFEIKKMLP